MPILYRPCVMFVEFKDFICNTDLYVIQFIMKGLYSKTLKLNFFDRILDEFLDIPDDEIIDKLILKTHKNPLMDYVDYSKMTPCNYMKVLDDMYNIIIFDSPNIKDNIQFTDLAASLKILSKTDECKKLVIYIDKLNPTIYELVYSFFGDNSKIELLTNNYESALKLHCYDSYFIRDVSDIEILTTIKHPKLCDVIVPFTRSNMNLVNIDEPPILLLPKPAEHLVRDNNMNITGLTL